MIEPWDPSRAQPKHKPRAIEKKKTDRDWKAIDDQESDKVRKRAKGRCEVVVGGKRCNRPIAGTGLLAGVHHHIFGWKLRGRGESALAKNKTLGCHSCHDEITKNILEHVAGNRYRRIR